MVVLSGVLGISLCDALDHFDIWYKRPAIGIECSFESEGMRGV